MEETGLKNNNRNEDALNRTTEDFLHKNRHIGDTELPDLFKVLFLVTIPRISQVRAATLLLLYYATSPL